MIMHIRWITSVIIWILTSCIYPVTIKLGFSHEVFKITSFAVGTFLIFLVLDKVEPIIYSKYKA